MSGTQVQITTPETGANPPETPAAAITPPAPSEGERPAWLPAEFKSVEAYVQSNNELRADHTRKSQELAKLRGESVEVTVNREAPKTPGQETPAETPNDPAKKTDEQTPQGDPTKPPKIDEKKEGDEDPAKKVSDAAGFDLNPFQTEYFSTGDVSVENRTKIAEGLKGVLGDNALDIVNQYIEGQKVTHANDRKLYMDEAGGDEAYTSMITWAATNLSKEEIGAYNKAIDSGDRHQATLAIRGLRSTFEAQNGRVPNNIRANGAALTQGTAPFNSSAEMVAAMNDPRYAKDQAYRDQVAARIAASPNL